MSFGNLPFASHVCHVSREGLCSKVPSFLRLTKLYTLSSLPFHNSIFWGAIWKVTWTFFTPNGHDPNTTYSISISFFISPQISAALPPLLLCYWNKREPDVGSWADRKGSIQRVNSFPPQSEAFCWPSVRWVWTKFNLAAVNRKVGRKIGFNKQSIKKKKKRRPQQEIIIWAIVHFVKGLACTNIHQDAMLCPGFLCSALSGLISYKSGSMGWRKLQLCCISGEQTHMSLKWSLAPAYAGETSSGWPEWNQYERKLWMPTEVVYKNNSLTIPSASD